MLSGCELCDWLVELFCERDRERNSLPLAGGRCLSSRVSIALVRFVSEDCLLSGVVLAVRLSSFVVVLCLLSLCLLFGDGESISD